MVPLEHAPTRAGEPDALGAIKRKPRTQQQRSPGRTSFCSDYRTTRSLCGLLLLCSRLSPARPLCRSNLVTCSSAHRAHGCQYRPSCLRPSRLLCERNFPARRCGERPSRPLQFRSDARAIPSNQVANYLDNLVQAIAFLLQLLQHPGEIRHDIPPHVVLELLRRPYYTPSCTHASQRFLI